MCNQIFHKSTQNNENSTSCKKNNVQYIKYGGAQRILNDLNPLDPRSRYTGGTVYQRNRQKTVYRRHGYQRHRREAGIPEARL